MSRAVIISNGRASDYSAYKGIIHPDDYVICADGGIKHLINLGIMPNLWIGDFDSCRFDDVIKAHPKLKKSDTLFLNKDKDETDTHFSCIKALEMGYRDIVILFACGGRIDHMLSNIHLLEFLNKNDAHGVIIDEKNTISLCSGSIKLTKNKKYLSIIPLDSEVVIERTEGLLYPLKDYTLPRAISMGVSNEIVDSTAEIHVKSGLALIIESQD